jgi:hypothetical protein
MKKRRLQDSHLKQQTMTPSAHIRPPRVEQDDYYDDDDDKTLLCRRTARDIIVVDAIAGHVPVVFFFPWDTVDEPSILRPSAQQQR